MAKKKIKKLTVLQSARKLDFKLLIFIAFAVALAGGFLVYTSYALSYTRPSNVICPQGRYVKKLGNYSVTCARISLPAAAKVKPKSYTCPLGYKKNASGTVVNCLHR